MGLSIVTRFTLGFWPAAQVSQRYKAEVSVNDGKPAEISERENGKHTIKVPPNGTFSVRLLEPERLCWKVLIHAEDKKDQDCIRLRRRSPEPSNLPGFQPCVFHFEAKKPSAKPVELEFILAETLAFGDRVTACKRFRVSVG